MKGLKVSFGILFVIIFFICQAYAEEKNASKKNILVVSSYDRDYAWSQQTNEGLCAAMLKFGYFDTQAQADEYTKNDYVESSKAIVKKLWMNAKKKTKKEEKAEMALSISKLAREFGPALILLGDDDAAEYIGGLFLDTEIPVVFWGVNNTPVKYGLVDSINKPGHNVTGVYQAGYYKESIELLKTIKPDIKKFAVVGDESSTARSHVKEIEFLARDKKIDIELAGTIITGKFEEFKRNILETQGKIDAFFIAQYSALKDEKGNYISPSKVAEWYSENVNIPEAVNMYQFVKDGMLCGADDSGYNQGYEAVVIADDILSKGKVPSTYSCRAPKRGKLMINVKRAERLKITLTKEMGIEEFIGKEPDFK